MTTSPAGWYPDPAGSGGLRWWNGVEWGEQVQPAPQWGATQQPAAPTSFVRRNVNSLLVAALVVVCVVIAATTGYIVFAFIPAFVAARAVQEKEPLAWPAVGVAVALIIWRFMA